VNYSRIDLTRPATNSDNGDNEDNQADPFTHLSADRSAGSGGSHQLVGGEKGIRTGGLIRLKVQFVVALEQIVCNRNIVV
jgi:hypothetical protein